MRARQVVGCAVVAAARCAAPLKLALEEFLEEIVEGRAGRQLGHGARLLLLDHLGGGNVDHRIGHAGRKVGQGIGAFGQGGPGRERGRQQGPGEKATAQSCRSNAAQNTGRPRRVAAGGGDSVDAHGGVPLKQGAARGAARGWVDHTRASNGGNFPASRVNFAG